MSFCLVSPSVQIMIFMSCNILLFLQLVAIPKPVPVQQPETVKTKPQTVAVKQSTVGGKFQFNLEQCFLPGIFDA